MFGCLLVSQIETVEAVSQLEKQVSVVFFHSLFIFLFVLIRKHKKIVFWCGKQNDSNGKPGGFNAAKIQCHGRDHANVHEAVRRTESIFKCNYFVCLLRF